MTSFCFLTMGNKATAVPMQANATISSRTTPTMTPVLEPVPAM